MKAKGLEILIKDIAKEECPSWKGLKDIGKKSTLEKTCIYGDGKHNDKCIECWEKSLQENYDLGFEMLEYGDTVELINGDICVYIRKELDASGGLITQELNLVNIFTGEEHNINEYRDGLSHDTDPNLSIKRFVN